jgi:CheY-like chemotaxis protein
MSPMALMRVSVMKSEPTPQPNVLIVEDDHDLRETVAEVLREEGYGVTLSSGGPEALARFREGYRPAAMIVDFGMPGMNGVEFLRECDATFCECGRVPTIVMSAHRPEEMAANGVDTYLRKPFTPANLVQWLRRLLPEQG